ncbi:MAG TPA: hypothetical protein VIN11_03145, partial [Roseivirga sp.]
ATSDILTIDNPSNNTIAGRFLTVGHDGRAYTDSQDVPAAFSNRLGKTWRVDVDGLTGTVDLTFDLNSLNLAGNSAEDFALIIGNTSTLSAGNLVRNGVYDANNKTIKFRGLTLSDGDHLSLAKDPVGPGGVKGANMWLRADLGATSAGSNLTAWEDQEKINTFTINGNPSYQRNGLNFNPVISFTNTGDGLPTNRLTGNTSIRVIDGFAVYKLKSQYQGTLVGSTTSSNSFGQMIFGGYTTRQNTVFVTNGSTTSRQYYTNPDLLNNFTINNIDVSKVDKPFITARINGKVASDINSEGGSTDYTELNIIPIIGGSQSTWSAFNGEVSEIVLFPKSLSNSEKTKVQSYLALKYGITLDVSIQNYLSSSGTILWNNTSYWNDVFGIGRDDISKLAQFQSNSINTGTGDGIGQSGKANLILKNPSSLDNGDFLMLGHNNGRLEIKKSSINGLGELTRLWKVKRTGDPGVVDLVFNISGIGLIATQASDFRLLIDNDGDGDFSSGNVSKIQAYQLNNNQLTFSGVRLPDGVTFTLAEVLPTNSNSLNANRIIVNPSFEMGSGIPYSGDHAILESQVGDNPEIDGWFSTHPNYQNKEGAIEHWKTGFLGVSSQNGQYFVELNASESSRLYQHVYLVNGESVEWRYFHRLRVANATEELRFSVYSDDGNTVISNIDTHRATNTSTWQERTGNFTWNQPSGFYQIGFESTTGGSSGNFLDNITIGLQAFTEFAQDTIRLTEGQSIAPYIYVNGQVKSASSFTIQVDGGDAIEGTDYRFSNKTVNIPPGNYALQDSIALSFEIPDNNIPQNERIIQLSIASTTGDVDERDANSDGVYQRTLVIIIEDDDPCKNSGTDTTFSLCATNGNSVNLLALLGGNPDGGGLWSDTDATGVNLSNPAQVNLSGLAIGTYRFTYTQPVLGICPTSSATLTIQIREPNPLGLNNTLEVCSNSAPINLFTSISGKPLNGGQWTEVSSSGVSLSNPTSVSFLG